MGSNWTWQKMFEDFVNVGLRNQIKHDYLSRNILHSLSAWALKEPEINQIFPIRMPCNAADGYHVCSVHKLQWVHHLTGFVWHSWPDVFWKVLMEDMKARAITCRFSRELFVKTKTGLWGEDLSSWHACVSSYALKTAGQVAVFGFGS